MHTEFKPWLADKATSYLHIVEFIQWSNVGKMFRGILDQDAHDLATDCWIWIWGGSCVARTSVKESYSEILIQDWKTDKEIRMTIKVAVTYYLREMGKKNKRHKKFIKECYEEMLMETKIVTTGESVDLDLKKEERVLMLWNAGEIDTAEAMEKLSITSRQSLYSRFEVLVARLKLELQGNNTAE